MRFDVIHDQARRQRVVRGTIDDIEILSVVQSDDFKNAVFGILAEKIAGHIFASTKPAINKAMSEAFTGNIDQNAEA